jgi:glycosyltransferase involved in cell wall biosynthesis
LSFSNKLAEFVARGKPVVATRLSSVLEYFPEGSLFYFESGDPTDLANRVIELYQSPSGTRATVSTASRYYQSIRWSVMEERYLALLDSLLARKVNVRLY